MFTKAFDVEFDRLANELHCFITALPDRNTTWKIGDVRTHGSFALLDDDDVFHSIHLVLFQPGLLPDASERSDRHIDTELTRDRYRSGLGWMTELPVTAACSDELPTICLEGGDDLPHFHAPVSMPNE
jgi:hypothetical protein